jgi:hypothetical protein
MLSLTLYFISACKVRKTNVTCVCTNRDDQNSAIVRVCFIRVYVFASAATFNTVFFLFSCKADVFQGRVSPYSIFIDDQFFDINLK